VKVIFGPLLEHHWPIIMRELPLALQQDTRGVIALNAETDELLAAVVCEDWTITSVQCHILICNRAALRAGFINEVANYVFTTGGRLSMYGMVPADNDKALRLNKHIGFTEVVRLKDAYDIGIDYVLMELRRENCPYWIQPALAQIA